MDEGNLAAVGSCCTALKELVLEPKVGFPPNTLGSVGSLTTLKRLVALFSQPLTMWDGGAQAA